ncbi:MAG TPA: glycosyltransferase [Candidatus Limnocylindrales bacterium]|jgi:spore maturation protein CgeB|nr:glycosyltransferase [Candidatus Limnocylindrales bacterium]
MKTLDVSVNGRARAEISELTLETMHRSHVIEIAPATKRNGHSFAIVTDVPDPDPLNIVILGLSIMSSWGNGHATTYRGLMRELTARGHTVLFLERETEFAANRDLPKPPYGRTALYSTFRELKERFAKEIRKADLVIVGSYVQEGAAIGDWVTRQAAGVTAFYDIDTPATLADLEQGDLDYLSRDLIPRYDMYLSFTGGPMLRRIEQLYGSRMARPLYGSVDTSLYYPEDRDKKWDLGYMGTYSEDRQPALDELLLQPACSWSRGRFVVAGPQYPKSITWPKNVKRYTHLSPDKHRAFYSAQKFTLNLTRAEMAEAGYSPSVRLFEAAACGTAIISDFWEGLDKFFVPNQEILITDSSEESLYYLLETTELQRRQLGERARARVLSKHTAKHRALELEDYARELLRRPALSTVANGL